MNEGFFAYLLVLAGSTYLIRALPFALVRRRIKNRFLQSFLYYIPYAVLAAMTFPAAVYATDHPISALAGIAVAIVFALFEKGLTAVALAACVTALAVGTIF
ncbi:MAG: AzlD domain-containing protein [Clostridia bacterium]|nr:AzlD domain-containing protein [Clostridia bacterium]